jgi:hypothetical protein
MRPACAKACAWRYIMPLAKPGQIAELRRRRITRNTHTPNEDSTENCVGETGIRRHRSHTKAVPDAAESCGC